jgi:hypothetical protein
LIKLRYIGYKTIIDDVDWGKVVPDQKWSEYVQEEYYWEDKKGNISTDASAKEPPPEVIPWDVHEQKQREQSWKWRKELVSYVGTLLKFCHVKLNFIFSQASTDLCKFYDMQSTVSDSICQTLRVLAQTIITIQTRSIML